MKDNKIEIIKSCGLSVIPEVDLTPPECSHYHPTTCIIEDTELEFTGISGGSQKEINIEFDKILKEQDNVIEQVYTQLDTNKYIPYQHTVMHTAPINTLLGGVIELINTEDSVIPKYIEIYSNSESSTVETPNSTIRMRLYNSMGDLVETVEIAKVIKVKSLYVFKAIDLGNLWDDITRVTINGNTGEVLSDLSVDVKLYYNIK